MKVVHVEAGARLHFGFLDLNGSLGRMFGGIGMGIDEPKVSLDVCRSGFPCRLKGLTLRGRLSMLKGFWTASTSRIELS